MSKKTTAGGEVDSYCTKCKLDLTHRIIAMVGDTIKKVECCTCGGHHLYRKPKSAAKKTAKKKKTTAKARSKKAQQTAAKAAEAERRKQWEEAIMGKSAADFTVYNMKVELEAGQLVRHKKFGDGVVIEIRLGDKADIMFEESMRTLIHSQH